MIDLKGKEKFTNKSLWFSAFLFSYFFTSSSWLSIWYSISEIFCLRSSFSFFNSWIMFLSSKYLTFWFLNYSFWLVRTAWFLYIFSSLCYISWTSLWCFLDLSMFFFYRILFSVFSTSSLFCKARIAWE